MRIIMKSFWGALVLATLFSVMVSGNAFAATNIHRQLPKERPILTVHCVHQSVHLNGADPATITCLDHQRGLQGWNTPYITTTNCNSASVTLWWDTSFNGPTICFSGNGFANLTDYPPAWYEPPICHCTSWNDQASGFALQNCTLIGTPKSSDANYPGYFAIDINGNGQKQYFKWNVSKSWSDFDGSNGILPNDSLSSIYIDC